MQVWLFIYGDTLYLFVYLLGLYERMLNNTSLHNDRGETGPGCYSTWGVIIATCNALSLVITVLHLVIIAGSKSLNSSQHRLILIHITLGNIFSSLAITAVYSCLPFLPVITSMMSEFRIAALLVEWPIFTSHLLFLIASIEQYYGAYKPLKYDTSLFIRHLPVILIVAWIFSFGSKLAFIVTVAALKDRFDSFLRIFTLGKLTALHVPLLIAGGLFIAAVKKLAGVRETPTRGGQRGGQEQTRRMSVYLMMIYIIFVTITVLDIALSWIKTSYQTLIPVDSRRLRNLTQPVYVISNPIIYGLRTEAYRKRLRSFFCLKSNE